MGRMESLEKLQIDQFDCRGMFGKPKYPNVIPKDAVILWPH